MSSSRQTPMAFLPLSPVTSDSFPKSQQVRSAANTAEIHKRRSSSLSSDGKNYASPGYKVLKVAPVHYGEHAGDHQEDWHDVAVQE